jgi:Flp pilus assembly protein CpaB
VHRIARLPLRHRRLLAALCAGLSVLLAVGAIRHDPEPGRPVLVAAHDLASGTVLDDHDVRLVPLPPDRVPAHSTADRGDVVGRTVAGPMRRGEVLTDARVLHADRLTGHPRGTVLATVRLADADALATIQVGETVDVVAVDPEGQEEPRVIARDVEVVSLPARSDDGPGVPIRVATTEETALTLARAALEARLSVLVSGG